MHPSRMSTLFHGRPPPGAVPLVPPGTDDHPHQHRLPPPLPHSPLERPNDRGWNRDHRPDERDRFRDERERFRDDRGPPPSRPYDREREYRNGPPIQSPHGHGERERGDRWGPPRGPPQPPPFFNGPPPPHQQNRFPSGPPPPPMVPREEFEARARLEKQAREQAERNARYGAPPPPTLGGGLPPPPPPGPPARLPMPPMPTGGLPVPPSPAARGLPMPPMPLAPITPSSGVWKVFRTPPPESQEYYFNTVTQQTQWLKPEDLKSEDEKAFPPCPWSEFKNEAGEAYFAHSITKESVWTKPQELIDWESAKAIRDAAIAKRLASAPAPASMDISNMSIEQKLRENQAKLAAKKEKKAARRAAAEAENGGASFGASGGENSIPASAPSTSTPASAQEDPVYSSKDEARAAFRSLLVEKRLSSRFKNFQDAIPLLQGDVRYRALKTPQEKKKAFTSYMEEVIRTEIEQKKQKQEELLAGFTQLMKETPEITHKSKFKTFLPILELDERYQNLHAFLIQDRITSGSLVLAVNNQAVSDKIEELFYGYVDALAEEERKKVAEAKREAKEKFKAFLREFTEDDALKKVEDKSRKRGGGDKDDDTDMTDGNSKFINADSRWSEIKSDPELTADPRWASIYSSDSDKEDVVEEWLDELDEIERAKEALRKDERRKAEKEKRVEFRAMLQEECNKLRIHTRSRFKDVIGFIKSVTRLIIARSVFECMQRSFGSDDPRYSEFTDFYYQQSVSQEKKSSKSSSVDPADHKAYALEKAKDLFTDFIEDLSARLEEKKKILKSTILKDVKVNIRPESTPAQLTEACLAHSGWSSFRADVSASDLDLIWLDIIEKVKAKIAYWHKKQKDDTIKVAFKLLKNLFASRVAKEKVTGVDAMVAESGKMTFDVCKELVDELNRPLVVEAPKPDLEDGEMEPEEGELIDEPQMITVPRNHSSAVQDGLDAWDLLQHPPLPPPIDSPPGTIFTTDEYLREAVEYFHSNIPAEIETTEKRRIEREKRRAAEKKEDEEMTEQKDASRKRRRSTSRSASGSRSRSRSRSGSSDRSRSASSSRSRSRSRSPDAKRKKTEDSTSAPADTKEDPMDEASDE